MSKRTQLQNQYLFPDKRRQRLPDLRRKGRSDGRKRPADKVSGNCGKWDWEKNTDCTPDSVAASSNRRVWWRCEQGHSFCTSIAHRVRYKSECPYCTNKKVLPGFNDLATVKPRLAAQWDPELNGTLTPQMVTAGSHQKVWWKCPAGHRWKAAVYSRAGAQENGCPVCAGRTQGRNIKW